MKGFGMADILLLVGLITVLLYARSLEKSIKVINDNLLELSELQQKQGEVSLNHAKITEQLANAVVDINKRS